MTEGLPSQALLFDAAERKQRLATDPGASAWVHANAGTGKTHVLVQRLLRLLLSGANPRSILCLTFTKSAAAEMEGRVLERLGQWATASGEDLEAGLVRLLGRHPMEAELVRARCLFATVVDAPGGLAITTIHAFCERVLRRYSFEANVPPGFAVLTEEEAAVALKQATASAMRAPEGSPVREALAAVAARASEGEFARFLAAMLRSRNVVRRLYQVALTNDPLPEIAARLYRIFGLAAKDTRPALIGRSIALLPSKVLTEAICALATGSEADAESAKRFEAVQSAAADEAKRAALKAVFMTKDGKPRKALMTAAVKKRAAALHKRLEDAQEAFLRLDEKLRGLEAVEATLALLDLAATVFERYEAQKRKASALDFDDLIEKTLSLLSRPGASDWVLYELDARIAHLLIDEAQDTSPDQWAIVERLTADFFAGESAREGVPTVFAVGDDKQSIFGFQGAAPELLRHYGAHYRERVRAAGYEWRSLDLDLSFRTLAPVLDAVDATCRSLSGFCEHPPIPHLAFRRDSGGVVELWDPERGESAAKDDVWQPDADAPTGSGAEVALADRIAARIRHWLDSGETLASRGRPIEPGDILILLRKREPMAKCLQRALARRGVAVAGADRMALLDDLAVMDLLALADALLQTEDDLALATVLKSPLLGYDDDDLFALAFGRTASLWQSLEAAAQTDGRHAQSLAKLRRWRDQAHAGGAFDFFVSILDKSGGRKAFAARLGVQCFDALDELLNLAEAYDARIDASLAGFLSFLRQSATEIKREADRASGEVRIMTVHGAKGLEADIVILADGCSTRQGASAPIFLLDDDTGAPPIPTWAVKGTGGLAAFTQVKEAALDAERKEQDRLLYVAMTRARDRLYVTGSHKNALPENCWFAKIKRALAPLLLEEKDCDGRTIWRAGASDHTPRISRVDGSMKRAAPTAPSWLRISPLPEAAGSIAVPSELGALENGTGAFAKHAEGVDRVTAQERGRFVHRLLEVLPAIPKDLRPRAARILASAFSSSLSDRLREGAIQSALSVLSHRALAADWTDSLSEAEIATLFGPKHNVAHAVIIGRMDRVMLTDTKITVVDYKSGVQTDGDEIAKAHLVQLACYRLALQRIYPKAQVNAVLFDTRLARAVEADNNALDAVVAELPDRLLSQIGTRAEGGQHH